MRETFHKNGSPVCRIELTIFSPGHVRKEKPPNAAAPVFLGYQVNQRPHHRLSCVRGEFDTACGIEARGGAAQALHGDALGFVRVEAAAEGEAKSELVSQTEAAENPSLRFGVQAVGCLAVWNG